MKKIRTSEKYSHRLYTEKMHLKRVFGQKHVDLPKHG